METTADQLARAHRSLDELLGRFFGAAHAGVLEGAREAIREFDEELRRHTALEEERFLEQPAESRRLVPAEGESDRDRLVRELRLEHVQIRELSAMLRRLVEEKSDLRAAERLAGNLARRWDAHTAREEAAFARLG